MSANSAYNFFIMLSCYYWTFCYCFCKAEFSMLRIIHSFSFVAYSRLWFSFLERVSSSLEACSSIFWSKSVISFSTSLILSYFYWACISKSWCIWLILDSKKVRCVSSVCASTPIYSLWSDWTFLLNYLRELTSFGGGGSRSLASISISFPSI